MPFVKIPAAAATHLDLPVCVRHGRPAKSHRPMRFQSLPPAWILLFLVLGGVLYLAQAAVLRKDVVVRRWPWCGRCEWARVRRAALGLAVFAAGVYAVTAGQDLRGVARLGAVAAALAFLVGGFVLLTRSTPGASAGVQVSMDGDWLFLHRAHEGFVGTLPADMPVPPPAPVGPPAWTVPPRL